MTKVVHILTDTNIGGAGVWLRRSLHYLEEDFNLTVIIPKDSLLKAYLSQLKKVQLIEVANIGDRSFSIKGFLTLRKVLKKLKPDVVHTHASLAGRLAAKVTKGCRCLNSRHCIEPVDRRPWVRQLKAMVNAWLSDQIIAVSHGVYENLLASGLPQDKVLLLPNGVDPLKLYSKEMKERTKAVYKVEGKKVIGYVGRLAPVKGPGYLLDLMAYMKKRGREDLVLLVAGEGPLKKSLQAQAKARGLEDLIQWLGFVEETEALYNIMDVCINTSRSEAISLTLLEAMSLGLPVMAFDVDGLDQVIIDEKNGYLIPAYDIETYGERLCSLLDQPDLQTKFGTFARTLVGDKYSMAKMVEQLKTTYKEKRVL